jgi:hypothetical protein
MAYVQKQDYSRVISEKDLDDLLNEGAARFQGKSIDQVLSEAGLMAKGQINAVLSDRYDLSIEFAKEPPVTTVDDSREQNILRIYLTIGVYWLHMTIEPRDIPEAKKTAYDDAIKELEKSRAGELSFSLVALTSSVRRLTVFEGHAKFVSRPFRDPLAFNE